MNHTIENAAAIEGYAIRMEDLSASEFFLVPGEPPAYRVGGRIERADTGPLAAQDTLAIAKSLFKAKHLKQLGAKVGALRGSCKVEIPSGGLQRVVIVTSRSQSGISLVGRRIHWKIPTPQEIRLPQPVLKAADAMRGLVIFTGPMGSGKTTAAAALLDHINAQRSAHICLLGDPLEFVLEPKQCMLQQKDVGADAPDYVSGMAAAIAQDLDVLYLSEISSIEDLKMCLTVALTGHLVITVLHARTAAEAVNRILSSLPRDAWGGIAANFAEALSCITALKLLPKAGGGGQVAAYDVLVPDDRMRAAIAAGEALALSREDLPDGCMTIEQSIEALVNEGLIDAG